MTQFQTMQVKSACNKLKRKIPYQWDLNIYRGCQHGCVYCYAVNYNQAVESGDFFKNIYAKENVVELLDRQLSSSSWKGEVINIGGVTDSYQPAEAKYKLMPEILKVMIKHQNPCIISTKSDLILRDFDLIAELAEKTYVNIATSITTVDESKRKKLEPVAASALKKFNVLSAFSKTEASTGLHVMPIIPYLTDSKENIEEIFRLGAESNVTYVLTGVLYLRGKMRACFFDFIRKYDPKLYRSLSQLYVRGGAPKAYKDQLYAMVNQLKVKHGLSTDYSTPMKLKLQEKQEMQLSFFDTMKADKF